MKKKQTHWFEPYKKWVIGVALSVIVVPCISLNWKHIQSLWASPEKLDKVSETVSTHESAREALTKLLIEQNARIEKNEAMDDLRARALSEQLNLIAELKKKK